MRVEGDSRQKATLHSRNHVTERWGFGGRYPILTVLLRKCWKRSLSEMQY